MNNKIIITILAISILIIGLSPVTGADNSNKGIDSSNWKEITINSIDFKIPPKYEGGSLYGENNNYTDYILESVFNFSIASLTTESELKDIYGYESTIDELNDLELKRIAGHDLVILHSYRSVCEHDVVYLFYAIEDEIYAISYNGNNITPEIKEIIKNTPKSTMSKETLYKKLDKVQESYIQEQNDYDEVYAYSEAYNQGYLAGKNSKHEASFVDYYCAYRLTRYLMR